MGAQVRIEGSKCPGLWQMVKEVMILKNVLNIVWQVGSRKALDLSILVRDEELC